MVVELSAHRADLAGQIALHPSHGIWMEEVPCGSPIEKDLHPPVLDFGRLHVLGVFDALHCRPKPGPRGAVTSVCISAQADALFRTLEIRQFGSFDPLASGQHLRSGSAESIDETQEPIKNRVDKGGT